MAKLRDTAVRDNLNIAGTLTASGKQLSVEGHTHTPANITGLDTYITQKIQAAGGTSGSDTSVVTPSGDINAKTLDGHPVSDFILKTEAAGNTVYSYSKILKFSSNAMMITIPESFGDYLIKITDSNSEKYLKNDITYGKVIKFTNFPNLYGFSNRLPIWGASGNTIAIYGIIPDSGKIKIEVYSSKPITNDLIISDTITGKFSRYYYFTVDKSTYSHLNYKIHDANINLVTPPKLIQSTTNTINQYNDLCIYGDAKIIDLDNDITFRVYNNSIYSYNPNNIPLITERAYGLASMMVYYVRGLSDNIVVVNSGGFVYYTNHTTTQNANISKDIKDNSLDFSIVNVKKLLGSSSTGGGSISATINGVQFDGKTNITTPATKLITPVHINGIEFDGSQDITIPAPTNALTLGGLDSSQYIKATDIGNAAGKIPRFDNDGFLVYPDGSKERIENA